MRTATRSFNIGYIASAVAIILLAGCATKTLIVTLDNDGVDSNLNADGNYTSGVEVSVSARKPYIFVDKNKGGEPTLPQSIVQSLNFLKYLDSPESSGVDIPPATQTWVEWGIGQKFFTPSDLKISTIQIDDRPYAGWLYGRVLIHNDRVTGDGDNRWLDDRRRSVGLQVGIVGPSSQASAVQKWWHEELCDCVYPAGWDNQLKDEPGFILTIAQEDRLWLHRISDLWLGDVLSIGEISVGNVLTQLKIGGKARLGYRLPRYFRGNPNAASDSDRLNPEFSYYFFTALTGQFVVRDIFLDGNTFRRSPHTVDKKKLYSEGRVGMEFDLRKFSVQVSYVHRTKQYKSQAEPDSFVSIGMRYAR